MDPWQRPAQPGRGLGGGTAITAVILSFAGSGVHVLVAIDSFPG
jgi:hypothetical protein